MILLAVLFFSSFSFSVDAAVIEGMQTSGKTLTDESGGDRICATDTMPFGYQYEVSKNSVGTRGGYEVGLEDTLRVNVKILPILYPTNSNPDWLVTMIANCQRMAREGKLQFTFEVAAWVGNTKLPPSIVLKSEKAVVTNDNMIGLSFAPITVGEARYVDQNTWGTLTVGWDQNQRTAHIIDFPMTIKTGRTGNDIQIPDFGNGGGGSTSNGETKDISKMVLEIKPTSEGKGLKDVYRTWVGDTQAMAFGQNNLDRINVACADASTCPSVDDPVSLPGKDDQWGYDGTPTFEYFDGGFNYTKDVKPELVLCSPRGWFSNSTCPNTYFGMGDLESLGVPSDDVTSFAIGFNPTIKPSVWASAKAGDVIEVSFIPRLVADAPWAVGIQYYAVFNITGAKTKIEVYADKAAVKEKCLAEHASDPTFCDDDNNIRYQVGKNVEATASTSEKPAGSLTDQLFDFIRKVVAYIVLLITSFVYYIFSTILVPVIVALIGIHPYQDKFVNFIYPGWVIIRNISNIFFIVALLWVGLRTLFQIDDASKSRSFIIRLILMALLVNFSLVIGQSIVAIADTVQSQFLPEGTKVVETLGYKLMVDPIVAFRGGSDSLTDPAGNFTTTALASDLPKAIILLILAVAAFFAFVALIAFMVVRLAALWILYMLSPLAYVGRILPQTEKMADRWWTEFTKYAFAVPIMAFFLNITALLAVTMSGTTGTSVTTGNSNTPALGGLINTGDLGAGVVSFAVTVISHFIILAFLFIGMKFAVGFGGVGAEKIVNAAKTGFKKAFDYPRKGAQLGTSMASQKLGDRGWDKTSKGLAALAHPKVFGGAVKKKWFDEPKEKRERDAARRLGDIKGLTRSNVTAKALDNAKAVAKDFDSEASGYLSAKMKEGDTDNNRFMTQGAMMGLAKNKKFDDIVKSAEDITGKKYGRNAAGLNAAVSALAKKQGWTVAEQAQMMKTLDHSASLDTKTAHYEGNADYNANTKAWTIRGLDDTADPDNTRGNQRLNAEDDQKWTHGLVKKRLGKNPTEDAKNFALDTMVTKDAHGRPNSWTWAQIGVMGGRDVAQLSNPKIGEKFRETDNFAAIHQAYQAMGAAHGGDAHAGLVAGMIRYNNIYNDGSAEHPKWTNSEINRKADLIHSNLMGGSIIGGPSSGGGTSGGSGGSGGGGSGGPSGGGGKPKPRPKGKIEILKPIDTSGGGSGGGSPKPAPGPQPTSGPSPATPSSHSSSPTSNQPQTQSSGGLTDLSSAKSLGRVKYDYKEGAMVPDPDGDDIYEVKSKDNSNYLIPTPEYIQTKGEYNQYYEKYYDMDQYKAGKIKVVKPARVEQGKNGWVLVEKGKLETE